MRRLVIGTAVLLITAQAAAQRGGTIAWSQKVEESVARAKKTHQPLMFWVLGRSASRDDRVERDQKRAFTDPLVLELSTRFVAARLSRSRYRDLLEEWNLSPKTNLEIVFVTPAGDKIDTLAPQGVGDPDILARKMTLVYRHYRQVMFDQELKPTLEDEAASDEKIKSALKLIAQFLILPADQTVITLLERQALSPSVRKVAYETLAALSTPAGVERLLEDTPDDEHAAAALPRCTPDAAEQMLPRLEDADPAVQLAVYHAVTRICKLRDVKPDRFWEGRNQYVKRKELDRVRGLVSATAERWRQRYAEHR